MNSDPFEQCLQRQTPRALPREWREQILSTAQAAAAPATEAQKAPRFEPGSLGEQLATLLWPSPAAWGALAAAWLVILSLHLATPKLSQPGATGSQAVAQNFGAFHERNRVLAELIGSTEPAAAIRPEAVLPRPRSERVLPFQFA